MRGRLVRVLVVDDSALMRKLIPQMLAGDESIRQPAVNAGCVHAKNLCGFPNRDQFPAGRFSRRLESWNLAISSQAADLVSGEAFAGRCRSSLTIQDSGDDFIGIQCGQARQ